MLLFDLVPCYMHAISLISELLSLYLEGKLRSHCLTLLSLFQLYS